MYMLLKKWPVPMSDAANLLTLNSSKTEFLLIGLSALTLLVGRQEGHLACKKLSGVRRFAVIQEEIRSKAS